MLSADGSSLSSWRLLQKTSDRQQKLFEKQPLYARDSKYFSENIKKITSVDALMKDRRVLYGVLSAFQLEDQVDSKALIRKIIESKKDDPKALANRLVDPRYRQLNEALAGLNNGVKIFDDKKNVDKLTEAYRTNEYEKYLGEMVPGMREALYFKRNIQNVTNLNQILSQPALKKVARVASGLPQGVDALDFDRMKSRYAAKIDVAKFKDSKFVDKFIDQYFIRNDIEQGGTNNSLSNQIAGLIQPLQSGYSFSV